MEARSVHARAQARRYTTRQREQSWDRKERIRFIQLAVCLVLFCAVFIGKGVFPQRLVQVRDQMSRLIGMDTDFRMAFSQLGESLARQDSMLGGLGEFCVEVFGGTTLPDTQVLPSVQPYIQESRAGSLACFSQYIPVEKLSNLTPDTDANPTPEPAAEPDPEPAVAAVGTVLSRASYDGPALPENYTMDHYSLGELETMTPLLGTLHSTYGYRDHPINGVYQFHGGADIGGQEGESIAAFADGKVDYIGQDDSYGLYLQLDHGNGIKSFYAHCSKLCVSKGQLVAMGEKIAEVGSTGNATGPHLHLELKLDGMHLDPTQYVETKSP